jgi:hypothetical protein
MPSKVTRQEKTALFLLEAGIKQYTITSNGLLEALMKTGHPTWLRVLCCVIRMSWGHDSVYTTVT